jgi:hypothetical protein
VLTSTGSGALQAPNSAGASTSSTYRFPAQGSYNAERLTAADTTISVSGVGNVIVNARRTLKASISVRASSEYLGDPQVTEHVSGMGRVRRHDSSTPGMRVASVY